MCTQFFTGLWIIYEIVIKFWYLGNKNVSIIYEWTLKYIYNIKLSRGSQYLILNCVFCEQYPSQLPWRGGNQSIIIGTLIVLDLLIVVDSIIHIYKIDMKLKYNWKFQHSQNKGCQYSIYSEGLKEKLKNNLGWKYSQYLNKMD